MLYDIKSQAHLRVNGLNPGQVTHDQCIQDGQVTEGIGINGPQLHHLLQGECAELIKAVEGVGTQRLRERKVTFGEWRFSKASKIEPTEKVPLLTKMNNNILINLSNPKKENN